MMRRRGRNDEEESVEVTKTIRKRSTNERTRNGEGE